VHATNLQFMFAGLPCLKGQRTNQEQQGKTIKNPEQNKNPQPKYRTSREHRATSLMEDVTEPLALPITNALRATI